MGNPNQNEKSKDSPDNIQGKVNNKGNGDNLSVAHNEQKSGQIPKPEVVEEKFLTQEQRCMLETRLCDRLSDVFYYVKDKKMALSFIQTAFQKNFNKDTLEIPESSVSSDIFSLEKSTKDLKKSIIDIYNIQKCDYYTLCQLCIINILQVDETELKTIKTQLYLWAIDITEEEIDKKLHLKKGRYKREFPLFADIYIKVDESRIPKKQEQRSR